MKDTMNTEQIHTLIQNFSRLERKRRNYMNQALSASGMKGTWYEYINTIKKHPGVSQDFLAEYHSVDKSRVARVARQLEDLGYISRSSDENDRRQFCLFLTESGEELYFQIDQYLMTWGRLLVNEIDIASFATTNEAIAQMLSNIDSPMVLMG